MKKIMIIFFLNAVSFNSVFCDEYKFISSGKDALALRLELIRKATSSINLATMIFSLDKAGSLLLNELIAASARKVAVRLILDARSYAFNAALVEYLASKGIEVRFFKSFKAQDFYPKSIQALHAKFLTIDDHHLILGGRNIRDAYFALEKNPDDNLQDMEIYVNGLSVQSPVKSFNKFWANSKTTSTTVLEPKVLQINSVATNDLIPIKEDKIAFHIDTEGDSVLSPTLDHRIISHIVEKINAAQKSIVIENAYFIPSQQLLSALLNAAKRNVSIKVITNGRETNDVAIYQDAYLMLRPMLLSWGIQIWESKKSLVHTKSFVVDGEVVDIGSFNINAKSIYFNIEDLLLIKDQKAASVMQRYYEDKFKDRENFEFITKESENWKPSGVLQKLRSSTAQKLLELELI
jgi:phosphatidylserine/phosphatidylglycerophosphate/cardiolipin synthase-like enzyme